MESNYTKKNQAGLKAIGFLTILLSGCGDEGASASDKLKAGAEATGNKATDIKDAAVRQIKESREDAEARLTAAQTDLQIKVDQLEKEQNEEVVPAVKTAKQKRLERVKASLAEANDKLVELKKSVEADWNAKKDTLAQSFESARGHLTSALDREKFQNDVDKKLAKINSKVESLKVEASKATATVKQKLDADRTKLEQKYSELKAENADFRLSTEEKWDHFKDKFSKSFEELSSAFTGLFE